MIEIDVHIHRDMHIDTKQAKKKQQRPRCVIDRIW